MPGGVSVWIPVSNNYGFGEASSIFSSVNHNIMRRRLATDLKHISVLQTTQIINTSGLFGEGVALQHELLSLTLIPSPNPNSNPAMSDYYIQAVYLSINQQSRTSKHVFPGLSW